ncbi:hypothetical protein AWB74_02117 [Caballeronia arvi]|uniref:Uncharacterized protein n=1 Tax=Caballeronia arvi TaxID=1777135 RepID=A0A158HS83_9BURK|nr:hypothetical protein [Caballeronia arvi]SAL47252.1 hypothetical protein AWB74_02117 [Caballeronia arvi]
MKTTSDKAAQGLERQLESPSDANIYRHTFVSRCPNNGKQIIYTFELRKPAGVTVYVEHIVTAAALYDEAFHEQIADFFFKQFGGQQVLRAHHHGVDIETRRGFGG